MKATARVFAMLAVIGAMVLSVSCGGDSYESRQARASREMQKEVEKYLKERHPALVQDIKNKLGRWKTACTTGTLSQAADLSGCEEALGAIRENLKESKIEPEEIGAGEKELKELNRVVAKNHVAAIFAMANINLDDFDHAKSDMGDNAITIEETGGHDSEIPRNVAACRKK